MESAGTERITGASLITDAEPRGRELQPAIPQDMPSRTILGVRVHDVSMEETLRCLENMACSGRPHHVVTVNPEYVMIARKDDPFRAVLNGASLAIPDGSGILWAARRLGRPMKERVTGIDAVTRFSTIARNRGLSVFLLGAAPGVAEACARRLQEQNPGLRVAGTYAGSPHASEEDAICRLIEAAKPDVLLVAYGSPRQDLWIHRNQPRLKVPLAMGVGGTFDFIAGVTRRAPSWIQRAGLEWFHRLVRQPHRWRRMLALPHFAGRVLNDRVRGIREL